MTDYTRYLLEFVLYGDGEPLSYNQWVKKKETITHNDLNDWWKEKNDCDRCVICSCILTGDEEQKGLCKEHQYDIDNE